MVVKHFSDIPAAPVQMEGVRGAHIREILTAREGTPNFAMRVFDLDRGGFTPLHQHDYEHEVFVLEGSGEVTEGDRVHSLQAGSVALMMPNVIHQFRNSGDERFRFICLIPNQD